MTDRKDSSRSPLPLNGDETSTRATEEMIAQQNFGQNQQKENKGFFRKIATWFGLASVMLAGISLLTYRNLTSVIQTADRQVQEYKVIDKLENIRFQMLRAALAKQRYIITGEVRYLKLYDDVANVILQEITTLRQGSANNFDQQRRVATLESLITKKLVEIQETTNLRKTRGFEAALQANLIEKVTILTENIEAKLLELEKAENVLLTRASLSAKASVRNTFFTLFSGIFLTFFILAVVYYFIYREILERKRTEAALQQERDFTSAVLDTSGA